LLAAAGIAALVFVLPAMAGPMTFRGVVIAKDSARKSIVIDELQLRRGQPDVAYPAALRGIRPPLRPRRDHRPDGRRDHDPGRRRPVTCALTGDVDVSDFAVGDAVIVYCAKIDDVWRLKAIKLEEEPPPPPPDYALAESPVNALTATEVTVDGDDPTPITCAVREGADLSAFHVDDDVSMKCVHTDAG